jgi:hypothetical protein
MPENEVFTLTDSERLTVTVDTPELLEVAASGRPAPRRRLRTCTPPRTSASSSSTAS